MKRILSMLLVVSLCLSMLVTGVSAAELDSSWNTDGGAAQGWTLEGSGDSFTLSRTGDESVTRRVWKNLLSGSTENFKVTLTVQVGEGGRAYLKALNSNIELTAKGGNGHQLYVGGSWVNAQDRMAALELTRSGGNITVKVTGATGGNVADEDVKTFALVPEDAQADNLEFGVENDTLGASVVYSNVTVEKNWSGSGATPDPTGKTPGEFGWETDDANAAFSGLSANDDGSCFTARKGSGETRIWKELLADNENFQVTLDVSTDGVGPRGYVKLMGQTVEFNSENAGSEQLYIKVNNVGKEWVSAAGYEARVTLSRVDGGALKVAVQGKDSLDEALTEEVTLPTTGEDSQRKEVELGVYGGTVSFANIQVINFYNEDDTAPALHGWEATGERWIANAAGTRLTGNSSDNTEIRLVKELITNRNAFTVTVKLTVDEGSSGYVKLLGKTVELDARGASQKDQVCVKVEGNGSPWADAKNRQVIVTVTRTDAGELSYTVQGMSGGEVTGEKLTGTFSGAYENSGNLELGVYAGRVIFDSLSVVNQEEGGGVSTELPLSDNGAFQLKATAKLTTGSFAMDLMAGKEKAATVRVTRNGDELSAVVQNADGQSIALEGTVTTPADEEGNEVSLSRMQGRSDLLVALGDCGFFTQNDIAELGSVDRVVLRATLGASFEEQEVVVLTKLVSAVEIGTPAAFVAQPGQGSKWTWGSSAEKGDWAKSDQTDKNTENAGDTVRLSYVKGRLGDQWTVNVVMEVLSSAKRDRRGVARLQLLDTYKNPKAIFTMETIGREMKIAWEATDRPKDGNWVKGEATDWRTNSDTAYNISIAKAAGSNELAVTVLGNRGYSHSFRTTVAQDVLDVICYAGLAAEETTAEFRNMFVDTDDGGVTGTYDAKAVYDTLMENFRDEGNERLIPVIFGYPNGYTTNGENALTVTVQKAGGLWESSILMMAMDTYYETLENGAEKIQVSQTIANTVNAFLTSYSEAELTSAPNNIQNHAMDDCGWNVTAFLLGYKHNTALGNTTQAEKCLDYAKKLFNSTYDAFYDKQLGGGLWYNNQKKAKSLYAATLALAGYDLYELTKDAGIQQRFMDIYHGVEDNLRRADGLYWIDMTTAGAGRMQNPYTINEGGSCTYLAGNMAMAVLNNRLGHTGKAKQTAEGMRLYETSGAGAYLNDRDAWNNTFFLGLWQRELLESGVLDERHIETLHMTADMILEHAVFSEGYYSAAWEGPREPSYKGYPWGYEGERNRWGSQVYENGYYIGSTPSQMMTSATTAHVLLAAASVDQKAEQAGARLTGLEVEGFSLFPAFHADVTAYALAGRLSTSAKEAVVTWTADQGVTVQVNGEAAESPLTVALTGTSTVVTLTAEREGETKTYKLTLTRNSSVDGGGGGGGSSAPAEETPTPEPDEEAYVAAAALKGSQIQVEGSKYNGQTINRSVSYRLGQLTSTDGDETVTVLTGAQSLAVTVTPTALSQAKDRLMLQTAKGAAVIPAETLRAMGAAYSSATAVTLRLSGAVELALEADGKAAEWNDPVHPFILALPDVLGDGQKEAGLTLRAVSGSAVSGARAYQGWAFFQVFAAGSYAPAYSDQNFEDVTAALWYADTMLFGKNTGLLAEGEMKATSPVTRGQAAMLMVRLLHLPEAGEESSFADVPEEHPCARYIRAAQAAGIVQGVGSGCYAPDRVVTRQELFVMLENALHTVYGLELDRATVCLERFADRGQIDIWAEEACAAMVNAGYIQGTSLNTISPKNPATCAECLQTFYNFYRNRLSGMPAAFFRDVSAAWEKEGAFRVTTGTDGKATATIGSNNGNYYAWDRGNQLAANWAVEADMTLQSTANDHGTFRLAFQNGGKDLVGLLTVDYDHINGGIQLQGQIQRNGNWETVLTSGDYEPCEDTRFHILAGRPRGTDAIYIEITGDKGFRYSELSAEIPKEFLNQFTYLGVGTYASAVTFADIRYGVMSALGAAPAQDTVGAGSIVAGDWTVGAGIKVRNGVMTLDKTGQTETWHSAKLSGDFHITVEFQPQRSYRSDGLTTTRCGFVNADNDVISILTLTGDPEGRYLLEAQYNDGSWFHLVANDWEEVNGERLTLDIQRQGTAMTLTLKSDQGYEKVSKTVDLNQTEMDELQQFGLLVIDSQVQVYRVDIQ